VGGLEYSADYPHYLQEGLRARLNAPGLLSVFGQGTSGDVNHVDVSTDRPQKGHEEAKRIGTALAGHVAEGLATVRPVERPRLAVATARVELPVQQYTPEEVANARSLFGKIQERKLPFLVGVKATKIVKIYDRYLGQPIPAQIQALRLGDDTAILTLPSEIFVELGLEIKKRSPFKHTILIELANDSFGYVPTKRAYDEGNYEPTNSTVQSGSGEKLVESAVGLLRGLTS
jgi:neutral ceramidase